MASKVLRTREPELDDLDKVERIAMDQPVSLLIVEDDPDFRDSCVRWMQRKGHRVEAASNGAEAIALCDKQNFDVGLFDLNMPGMSGIELLQQLRDEGIDMEVIILTGQGNIESAVQAMKVGATDYLTKPCPLAELERHCLLAQERGRLRRENQQLRVILSRSCQQSPLVGKSAAMEQIRKLIAKISPTDRPVLITGESGTGKEVVAKAVHEASLLANMPMVTINCAALPEQLVESELFGHQKGAFTGATGEKQGLFEVADGGTLFIDELGELPLALQPKLLRVLEDGSMRRIGSHRERKVKVRIIAATNRDLTEDVKAGRFREDLFYRVNVLPVHLPPLRERTEDIDPLLDYFLAHCQRSHHGKLSLADDARERMKAYAWPGNVRELINVIQRACILADGNRLTLQDLPTEISGRDVMAAERTTSCVPGSHFSTDRLDEVVQTHVLGVLQKVRGNKAQAARSLGIHRRKLYRLLERFQNPANAGVMDDEIA